jgi:hypothetical protein
MLRPLRRGLIMGAFTLLAYPCIASAQSPPEGAFPLERDHVFVWISKNAEEVVLLERLGLTTDHHIYRHTGQGTASMSFQFENAYLEMIWVEDEEAAAKKDAEEGSGGAHFIERFRWKQSGASPFGVGLRRRAGASGALPFATRKYRAPWMEPNTFIDVALSASNIREPMYFVVPEYMALPSPEKLNALMQAKPGVKALFTHSLGVHKLTDVKVTVSGVASPSATASLLSKNGVAKIESGEAPGLELVFDGGSQGKSINVRPALPITLRY